MNDSDSILILILSYPSFSTCTDFINANIYFSTLKYLYFTIFPAVFPLAHSILKMLDTKQGHQIVTLEMIFKKIPSPNSGDSYNSNTWAQLWDWWLQNYATWLCKRLVNKSIGSLAVVNSISTNYENNPLKEDRGYHGFNVVSIKTRWLCWSEQ